MANVIKRKRVLRISNKMLIGAGRSKDRLEALAFTIICKGEFSNSIIYRKSHRKIRAYFHIGNGKVKKLFANCVKYGYMFVNENGDYQIPKLTTGERSAYQTMFFEVRGRDRGEVEEALITLNDMIRELRDLIAVITIEQKNTLENRKRNLALRHERNEEFSADDTKRYQEAKRWYKRTLRSESYGLKGNMDFWEMTSEENLNDLRYNNKGISFKTFAKRMGVSINTARKIIKNLIGRNVISSRWQFDLIEWGVKGYVDLVQMAKYSGIQGGSLLRFGSRIYLRRANIYSLCEC